MTTLPRIKKIAWKWFSVMIRLEASNDVGQVECVTCGSWDDWKEMDAGHFIAKNKGNQFYFEERNVHAQCHNCNRFKAGNLVEYSAFIIKTYGLEGFEEIKSLPQNLAGFNIPQLEEMRDIFKGRAKEAAIRRGIKI